MDDAAITTAFVGAQAARIQIAAAAKMMRMNAQADRSIARLLEAARDNSRSLANLAAGVGANIDITA